MKEKEFEKKKKKISGKKKYFSRGSYKKKAEVIAIFVVVDFEMIG